MTPPESSALARIQIAAARVILEQLERSLETHEESALRDLWSQLAEELHRLTHLVGEVARESRA